MKTSYAPGDKKRLWPFVSQNPKALSDIYDSSYYQDELLHAWQEIEKKTGHAWNSTSFIRDSPSHSKGSALDIAPTIAAGARASYAVYNNSDPVLYKRVKLIRDLQKLATKFRTLNPEHAIGVFIEPDHLHLQVLARAELKAPMRVYKWKIQKDVYPDSHSRMMLPLIT